MEGKSSLEGANNLVSLCALPLRSSLYVESDKRVEDEAGDRCHSRSEKTVAQQGSPLRKARGKKTRTVARVNRARIVRKDG